MSVLGGIVQAFGKLYAATMQGGVSYKARAGDRSGIQGSRIVEIFGDDGIRPSATLTVSSDGRVFGTTTEGGDNNAGVLFEYVPSPVNYSTASFRICNGR